MSVDVKAATADPGALEADDPVCADCEEFAQGVATTKNHVLVTTLENVQGRAYVYTHGKDGKWSRLSCRCRTTRRWGLQRQAGRRPVLSGADGIPDSLKCVAGECGGWSLKPGKTQKALFDASRDVVEQLEATSKDGTKVPYFIVHRKDMPMDGSTPTRADGVWRVPGFEYALLLRSDGQAVAGARRQFCAGEYSWRRRVWAGVARGWIEDAPAADL